MDKSKFISRWILTMGILLMLLGLIHDAFTPEIYQMVSKALPKQSAILLTYMFLSTGNACIFMGLLTIYASYGLKKSKRWAWVITLAVAIFIAVLGVSAIVMLPNEPGPYASLAIAALMIIPLLIVRKNIRA